MTICVCEANGGVLPRQVLIDTDGRPAVSDVMTNKTSSRTLPPPCSHPHHLSRKKGTSLSRCLLLAEMVGFEPTCPIKDKTISSRSRYDHFDTSPYISLYSIAKKRFSVNTFLPLRHGCKPYAAGPFCVFGAESAVSLQKRLFFWAGAEYNRNDIFQI